MNERDRANILMVDDQAGKLLSYEAILSELGENLIKARSAREAMEQLLRNDIAVVLMDVSMPEINGFELADMMHRHPRFQKTAIIFISAVHLSDPDRIKGYQSGAVDYIAVPIVPELLRAKVECLHRAASQDAPARTAQSRTRAAGRRAHRATAAERRAVQDARQLHPAAGLDGRRPGLDLLVQPALVRLHRRGQGRHRTLGLDQRAAPRSRRPHHGAPRAGVECRRVLGRYLPSPGQGRKVQMVHRARRSAARFPGQRRALVRDLHRHQRSDRRRRKNPPSEQPAPAAAGGAGSHHAGAACRRGRFAGSLMRHHHRQRRSEPDARHGARRQHLSERSRIERGAPFASIRMAGNWPPTIFRSSAPHPPASSSAAWRWKFVTRTDRPAICWPAPARSAIPPAPCAVPWALSSM